MTRDLALGGILLAFSAAYYGMAAQIPQSQLADAVGPQGLPNTYAAVLALLSLVLIGRALRIRLSFAARAGTAPASRPPRTIRGVAGMLAIGAVYVAVVTSAGYLVSLACLIVGTTYYQGGVINRHVMLVGAAGALVLWLVFVLLLGIPQPPGVWSSLW